MHSLFSFRLFHLSPSFRADSQWRYSFIHLHTRPPINYQKLLSLSSFQKHIFPPKLNGNRHFPLFIKFKMVKKELSTERGYPPLGDWNFGIFTLLGIANFVNFVGTRSCKCVNIKTILLISFKVTRPRFLNKILFLLSLNSRPRFLCWKGSSTFGWAL